MVTSEEAGSENYDNNTGVVTTSNVTVGDVTSITTTTVTIGDVAGGTPRPANGTSVAAQLEYMKQVQVQRLRLHLPRPFFVEWMAAYLFVYWGIAVLLPSTVFDYAIFRGFRDGPFSENQLGFFLLALGIGTGLASFSHNLLARFVAMVVNSFAWTVICFETFKALPYTPTNGVFLFIAVQVVIAAWQIASRIGEKRHYSPNSEDEH